MDSARPAPPPGKERPGDASAPQDSGEIAALGCFHPDHGEVVRYFHENRVYSVQIESCLSCSGGCRYCYASARDAPAAEIPAFTVQRLLREASGAGVRAIDWLGGDPLCRTDWYELAREAGDLGLVNNIWTSGVPLADPAVARRVARATSGGFVSVHLDSLDESIYRLLHTGEAALKQEAILRGVENLLACGKPPAEIFNCITFTRPLAGSDVERTIRYFATKGIRTCLTQICRAGLGAEHPEWVPSGPEIAHAVGIRDRLDYPGSDVSISTMDTSKVYCGGVVCVTVEGDVTPCSVIRQGFGNVNREPFDAIVDRHRRELLFLPLREPGRPGRCGSCTNQPVCWGCRATAYYMTGDAMADDPTCRVGRDS